MKLSYEIWPHNPYGEMGVTGVPLNSWGDKPIEFCVDRVAEYGYSGLDFFYTRFLDCAEDEYERLSRELKGYVRVEWEGWFKGGSSGVGDMEMTGMGDMDRSAVEAYEFLAPIFET